MEPSPNLSYILDRKTIEEDRRDIVESYVETLDEEDTLDALSVSEQLGKYGGRPLPDTVVVVPVAAHTESRNITNALAQYANQRDAAPFAVHLHLNWPAGKRADREIQETFQRVWEAEARFPYLDIRVSSMEYDEPVIGHIRRAAWNGTLMHLAEHKADTAAAIGVNHDIDVVRMSRFYVKRVQNYYTSLDSDGSFRPFLPPAVTQLKHHYDPRYPHTSRAVFWSDFTSRSYKTGFEAGMTFPFATYAGSAGFRRDARTYETRPLTQLYADSMDMIPGTSLETSARRYLDRLGSFGMREVWTDESFGADDTCRRTKEFDDITYERLSQIVAGITEQFGEVYLARLFKMRMTREQRTALMSDDDERIFSVAKEMEQSAMRTFRSAQLVLRNVVKVPVMEDYLRSGYFNATEIRARAMLYRQVLLKSAEEVRSVFTEEQVADTGVTKKEKAALS